MGVLDWLTGNADRHRLEFTDNPPSLVLLDNGKGFGLTADEARLFPFPLPLQTIHWVSR